METMNKGKSPFYPGQPVPIDFFTGRINEINRLLRAVKQVELGKPQAVFIQGEYGIGKSSLASFIRFVAEKEHTLLGIHVLLGGAETIEDVVTKTLETILKSQLYKQTASENIRNFLARYIGKQEFFGFSIDFEKLKIDSPNLTKGFLPFLRELFERVKSDNVKGILLILDEINGIAKNSQFSHFIKTLVDENSLSQQPLPLMLVLCGVEERRKELIQHHQPVERIFDIVNVSPMGEAEIKDFYKKSFQSVGMEVEEAALSYFVKFSAGFPKIMHVIGDIVFWMDTDNTIDEHDAIQGIFNAAEEIGKKFVDQQVYRALRSKDYHSILKKLSKENVDISFHKSLLEKGLSATERKKLNNFLQRMKKLNVLKSGEERGEYVFNSRLVLLYFKLKSLQQGH